MKSYRVERGAGGPRRVSALRLLALAVAGTVCCAHGAPPPPLAAPDAAPRTASAGEGMDEAQGRRAKEDGFAEAARLSIAVEDGRWSEGKGAAVILTVENDSDEKIDLPTVPQLRLAEVGAGDGGARAPQEYWAVVNATKNPRLGPPVNLPLSVEARVGAGDG